MELTHEEESVLSGISFNAEQIKNGVLDDNDMALLKEMRAVAAYLNAKYPGYKFEITGCELKNGTVKTYNEWYFKAEGIERDSAFIALFEAVDGTTKIRDDFYGEIVRKEIQDTLVGILTESGLPVGSHASFQLLLRSQYTWMSGSKSGQSCTKLKKS